MVKRELKQLQDVLQITEIVLCNEFRPPCAGLFLLKACCVFSQYYTADKQYSALKSTIKTFLYPSFFCQQNSSMCCLTLL